MKKILILGSGFTANKRLDPVTLQFKRAPIAESSSRECDHPWHWGSNEGSPLGSISYSKEWFAGVVCPHCESPERAVRNQVTKTYPYMPGGQWKKGVTHPPSTYFSHCPTCGSDDCRKVGSDGAGFGVVVCNDQWHSLGKTVSGWLSADTSHNAPLVKNTEIERCPQCDQVWNFKDGASRKDLAGGCENEWHDLDQAKKRDAPQVQKPAGEPVWKCWRCGSDDPFFHCGRTFSSDGDQIDTIDLNLYTKPTWIFDLNASPWPCNVEQDFDFRVAGWRREPHHDYDEVHAYEILEHLGQQGDYKAFFECFAEIWCALKPGGLLFASVPSYKSIWAWGDPSHTRIINAGSIIFLMREQYAKQIDCEPDKRTAMSDFRKYLVGDWSLVAHNDDGESYRFVLRAK
jgi:hypothetical protein